LISYFSKLRPEGKDLSGFITFLLIQLVFLFLFLCLTVVQVFIKVAGILLLTLVTRLRKDNYGNYTPAPPLTSSQKECLL